jgi:hypothetical protein
MRKLAVIGALAAGMLSFASGAGAAIVDTSIGGAMSNSDNGCINIIPLLGGEDCSYAKTRFPAPGGWQGPIYVASYYPLGRFAGNTADGFAPSVGDDKIDLPLFGTFTIDDNGTPADGTDDKISGTFSFGATDRWASTGQGDQALERWTSWDHTLAPTTVNFATAQPGGGFEYVIGVRGKPTPAPLSLAADATQVFGSEAAPAALTPNPWNTSGADLPVGERIGIERSRGYGNFDGTGANLRPNAGATTTATFQGYECFDADNDCTTSFILNGSSTVPGSITTSLPPGFTNLILIVTTGADGRITTGEGYWTREYIITAGPPIANNPPGIPTTNNSWTGSRFTFKGCSVSGPTGVNDAFSVDEGASNSVLSVLGNDTLSCSEPNTIAIVSPPANGTATVNSAGTAILYTPDVSPGPGGYFDGPDSLTYTITDGASNVTAVTTVDITVDEVVPTAQNCSGSSNKGAAATCIALTNNTIGSGTIAENTIVPGAGTLGTCTASGTNLVFTPTPGGGNGTGGCSFTITDAEGDVSNTANFTVTVTGNSASTGSGGPSLPSGGSSSLGLLGLLALLAGLPLAARRRKSQR